MRAWHGGAKSRVLICPLAFWATFRAKNKTQCWSNKIPSIISITLLIGFKWFLNRLVCDSIQKTWVSRLGNPDIVWVYTQTKVYIETKRKSVHLAPSTCILNSCAPSPSSLHCEQHTICNFSPDTLTRFSKQSKQNACLAAPGHTTLSETGTSSSKHEQHVVKAGLGDEHSLMSGVLT